MTSSVRTSRKSVQSALQNCFFPFFSVDQATESTKLWWPTTVTAKQKTSRKNQKPHGKNKNLTAKTKTSRQKQKPHGKNKSTSRQSHKPNAKPNTSQQKQNSLGFAVGICFPNIRKRIRR